MCECAYVLRVGVEEWRAAFAVDALEQTGPIARQLPHAVLVAGGRREVQRRERRVHALVLLALLLREHEDPQLPERPEQ